MLVPNRLINYLAVYLLAKISHYLTYDSFIKSTYSGLKLSILNSGSTTFGERCVVPFTPVPRVRIRPFNGLFSRTEGAPERLNQSGF